MSTKRATRYNRGNADASRRAILSSRSQFWRPGDIDAPPSTAQRILADLVAKGELRHIRKGLYWRGIKTPLGMAPPSNEALVLQLANSDGIGPAGLSAANALRLSTQIPRQAHYAVVSRPPSDTDSVHFVNRSARHSRADSKLSPTEVAALEVLDDWDQVIETDPREAMTRLTSLIRSGRIDAPRLARGSETEPGSARARLRYLLRNAGLPALADIVRSPGKGIESRALAGLAAA
jgi:hypothetical protein